MDSESLQADKTHFSFLDFQYEKILAEGSLTCGGACASLMSAYVLEGFREGCRFLTQLEGHRWPCKCTCLVINHVFSRHLL